MLRCSGLRSLSPLTDKSYVLQVAVDRKIGGMADSFHNYFGKASQQAAVVKNQAAGAVGRNCF
jgi:hypothetical protein